MTLKHHDAKIFFAFFVALLFIIPLLAGGLSLAKGFDGLYGQDAFAYYDYATVDLAQQLFPPPPFFWPPGYPLLILGASQVIGVTPLAGQLVSLIAGGLAVAFTALLTHDITARLWTKTGADEACLVPTKSLSLIERDFASPVYSSWIAGLAAGLSLAVMGQLWQSSAVLMADTTGLAAATIGLWAVVRYTVPIPSPNMGWGLLALASGALAYAIITRYGYAPLAMVCGVYALIHMQRHLKPHQIMTHAVFAAIPALIILAPVLIPALLPVETPTFGGNFGRQFASWDISNAFRRDFENPDGFFHFSEPNLVYYLHLIAQRYYFGGVLPILAFVGLWVLAARRRWGMLALLVGGFAGLLLLLVGLPQQNVRFALAYMPIVAALIGLGFGHVWNLTAAFVALSGTLYKESKVHNDSFSPHPKSLSLMERDLKIGFRSPFAMREKGDGGMRAANTVLHLQGVVRLGITLIFTAVLIFNGVGAARYTSEFIDRHMANLETVRWAESQMEVQSEVIVFGLTATMAHYTGLTTYEIYSLTPDDLVDITTQGVHVYLLLDVYNIETQWVGRSPQVNYLWLRDHVGLVQIGKRGHFTLFEAGHS